MTGLLRFPALLLALLFTTLLTGGATAKGLDVDDARQQFAERNFATIMSYNEAIAPLQAEAAAPPPRPALVNLPEASKTGGAPASARGERMDPAASVEVPLEAWQQLRKRLKESDEKVERSMASTVVLGASSYSGSARGGVLHLTLDLKVTLSGQDRWKVVPVIGEDVVIARATAGGKPIPLSTRDGYHVWVTRETGEQSVQAEILVPPRGPRGSIEYDFLVARTPETRFLCSFPTVGLEPRLGSAIRADVRNDPSSTRLEAWTSPTSRIHLVGFKGLGEEEGRDARLYVESLNLLSVGDGVLDLFTVFRYNILYAGAREFRILLPRGFNLVSADGEGAFTYTTENVEEGTLLKGETAFPIRNTYEISIRLRQETPADAPNPTDAVGKPRSFVVELPRARNVEREYGWLGVEVSGNVRLDEEDRGEALAVDARQLPWVIVQSAISPILRAYRIVDARAGGSIRLSETRLPEIEPASASIDRIRALTVLSSEGKALTDLRVTLRNRLRPTLTLRLPPNTRVRSSFLDGDAVRPSLAPDGAMLFPLKRSAGVDSLEPFTLQVVLESDHAAVGFLGRVRLALPALDLPISTLHWDVAVPARNTWSRLEGDIEAQGLAGRGHWHLPPSVPLSTASLTAPPMDLSNPTGSGTGAMPVRIELPRSGRTLTWIRYWISADAPIEVTTWYLRSWLKAPLLVLGLGLSFLTSLLAVRRWKALEPGKRVGMGFGGLLIGLLLLELGSFPTLLLGLLLGVMGVLSEKPGFGVTLRWVKGLLAAPSAEAGASPWSQRGFLGKAVLLLAGLFVSLVLLVALLRLLFLLDTPLGG
jgi:hypothetical protein